MNETTLLNIFELFTTDTRTEAMEKPFEINGKIYATNGYSLIRCDKSFCDFEINNPHDPPQCEAIMPIPNINKILKIKDIDFIKYKTSFEKQYIGKDIDCPHCDGTGEVEWEYEGWTKEDECPACNGGGLESKGQYVNTDIPAFGNYKVKIKDTCFDLDRFYDLIKVQQSLGGDISIIYHLQDNPHSKCLFKVGFCEILVMPCYYSDLSEGIINIEMED